ncbi:hypothetical protein IU471_33550, partial [Nocardia elegans]|nr:hypothetical protein [Nocardia elegans]
MLAAVNRESELLDGVPEQRKSIGGNNTKSVGARTTKAIPEAAEDDEDIDADERENAEIAN